MRPLKPFRSDEIWRRARTAQELGTLAQRFSLEQLTAVLRISRRTAWRWLDNQVRGGRVVQVGQSKHELRSMYDAT
ncbi:hypothetical protein SAMN02745121_00258 [Nannocystis exedens]|uniref:Uncharacterized protein n=1 Tax=Nannocystis exedens TaxID=54 RepID=A0A1I1STS8_9BACT|nr:hypothetical protein [Nannocystis exedens]PCC75718.1 hypothetical protein NAEX_08831 [Nannocystis exedens]SFD49752.1 hypothetical protein SAMN02745121_00258 [Nannocystis exedens]